VSPAEPPWLPDAPPRDDVEEEDEGMPGMDEPPPLEPPADGSPLEPLEPPLDPPGMLLDEPPDEPPPLDPDEPPEEPEEPPEEPLGMLDGMEEEEDCCWLAHPPIRNADTEPMARQWAATVSSRRDVSDVSDPTAEARVD
jgi:hypothetical protein